jgi:hypothetical protein
MDALTKKKADRFRFLNRLYERTGGDRMNFDTRSEIAEDLGMSSQEALSAANYLEGERLIQVVSLDGALRLTHAGIVEVERALSEPEKPTHYFPAVVNITNVHTMVGSQIQQGTHGSTQSQTVSQNDLQPVRELVAALRQQLASLQLDPEARSEAESELETVEAQLKSSKPKAGILRESLKTLRSIVEGVAATAAANAVLPLFGPIAAWLNS